MWYIEARPWNGPKDGQTGFAQVDPVSRGSGVVVTFTKVMPDGERQPRSYILTCAHVVRDSSDCLLEDIICYPPGSGYVRTAENSRRCGTFPNAEAQPATVSNHSPCRAAPGPRSNELKKTPASDWVLLEINNPSFYHQQAICAYENEQAPMDAFLTLIGFPFGAGTLTEKRKAETEGRGNEYPFWKDGRSVKATVAKNFRPADNAEPGMLDYEGPEESRSGMSGGGVFDDSGALVAIHRSNTESTMRRGAIYAESIVRFLRDTHTLEFAPGKSAPVSPYDWRPSLKISAATAGLLAILCLVKIFLWPVDPPKSTPFQLMVSARHTTENSGMVPVEGLKIGFVSDQWPGVSIDGETDSSGQAKITFTPNITPNPGEIILGYLVCRNEPSTLGDDAPYILTPYGRLPDGLTKEKQFPITRGGVDCIVMGRKKYLGGSLTRVLVATREEERTHPSIVSATSQDLMREVAEISSSEGFTAEEVQFATEGWSEQLKEERPVVSLTELEKYIPADATALRRLSGSVGRLHIEGGPDSYSSSAFLIADNLVLVPDFALPFDLTTANMQIEFQRAGGFDAVSVVKVAWRSDTIGLALCEIPRTQRIPLKIGIYPSSPPADSEESNASLSGRRIVVLGFPSTDTRLPKALNDLFVGVDKQLAAMPGSILAPTRNETDKSEISHDATTSAGVSGGPVIDLDSLTVIAMHKSGVFSGERKENQATTMRSVWDDPSFLEALRPYGLVSTENIGISWIDPLRLSKADRFVSGYNPRFLGCSIPLPSIASRPSDTESGTSVLDYVNFTVRMHSERRMALYAAANIDRSLLGRVRRERDVWHYDPRISRNAQLGEEIYMQNDFDRGHLIARSAVAWGPTFGYTEKAASSVFYWPNATPQHSDFNRSGWMKLERKVYEELQPDSKRLTIFCGPVFDASDIAERDALVPRRFWMIGVYENAENSEKPKVHAFLAEQYRFDAAGSPVFVGRSDDCVKPTTLEKIQSATGLVFGIPK